MDKTEFLTCYSARGSVDVIRETLPTVLEESRRAGTRVLVHTFSSPQIDAFVSELRSRYDFFHVRTDDLNGVQGRRLDLHLAHDLYAPEVICLIDGEFGFKPGFVQKALESVRRFHRTKSPDGFHFGIFSGCSESQGDGFLVAPSSYWLTILGGLQGEETVRRRQESRGFRTYVIEDGLLSFVGGEEPATKSNASGPTITIPSTHSGSPSPAPPSPVVSSQPAPPSPIGTPTSSAAPVSSPNQTPVSPPIQPIVAKRDDSPMSVDGCIDEGRRFFEEGKVLEATRAFHQALERDPRSVEAWNDLAVALNTLGETKGALEALQTALSIDPVNPLSRENLEVLQKQMA